MAHRYTTLLLDADETIFDFNRAEHDSLEKVLADRNLPHGEEILSAYHRINAALWRAFERGEVTKDRLRVQRFEELFCQFGFPAGIDPDEISTVYLEQLGESDYLLPGADRFLYALKNGGFDLALITNGVARTQMRRLNKSGLAPLFSHVFVSEAIGAQKPLPAFFDAVFAAIDEKDKRKVLVIGDSLGSDIQGAANAGLDCVWYNPKGLANDRGLHVALEAKSFGQILAFLEIAAEKAGS